MKRGEIYTVEVEGKKRPVVVLTRDSVLPVLQRAVCAVITTTVRGLRSEVPVSREHGVDHDSVINCDWLITGRQSSMIGPIGELDSEAKHRLDAALRFSLCLER